MALPPFQLALDQHRDSLARFLAATVGPQEADDCLQETLIAALRAYPRLRDGSNVRAWLFTIARNKAMDEHRARVRRPVPVPEADPSGSGAGADEPGGGLLAPVRAPAPQQSAGGVAGVAHAFPPPRGG